MKTFLIKHVIYPIHEVITGRPVLKRAAELDRSQWLSPDELRELQWRKLQAVLAKAQANVPYYRRAFAEAGVDVTKFSSPDDMRRLPVLTKSLIRDNLTDMIADGVSMSSLKKDSSGGSTGENVVFYHDKNCRANFLGAVVRNHEWCKVGVGELEVMVWGSAFDLSTSGKLQGKVKSALQNLKMISAYQLKAENMPGFVDMLRSSKPALMTGYATAMDYFARYLIENGISDIRPKAVICSAEMLFPNQRETIEKGFGCKVYNRYGCREFGTIAHECECGGFHVNQERVFVESVPEDDCPEGLQPGELLVTDLDSFGMPMIRYRIGDIARFEDPSVRCKCGRGLALISEIQGRTMDVVRTLSGRMLPGTFWTILTRSVPGINQFQVIQEKMEHIVVNLNVDERFPKESVPSLQETVKEYCGKNTQVDINLVDHIEPGPSGKFRFVISKVKP